MTLKLLLLSIRWILCKHRAAPEEACGSRSGRIGHVLTAGSFHDQTYLVEALHRLALVWTLVGILPRTERDSVNDASDVACRLVDRVGRHAAAVNVIRSAD